MYIVIEESVYRHAIKGVFDLLSDAQKCAFEVLKDEKNDKFHHCTILEAESNTRLVDATPIKSYHIDSKWENGKKIFDAAPSILEEKYINDYQGWGY